MPNYDYHCDQCDIDFEDFAHYDERDLVSHCGELATRVFRTMQKPRAFRAGFFPHLDKNPVYAGSKQQLKDECNRRDLFAPYAWD